MQEIDCQIFLEKLPLWFAGSLSEHEVQELINHMKVCSECLGKYRQEYPLFALAGSKAGSALLDEHPEIGIIDQYVFEHTSLTDDQISEVDHHLRKCSICSEIIKNLELLPTSLSDLISLDLAPHIIEIEKEVNKESGATGTTTFAKLTRLKPLIVFSVAAVLLLIAIYRIDLGEPQEVANISVTFPAVMRGIENELIFVTQSEHTVLDAKLYIEPEENHYYSVTILDSLDSPVLDNLGITKFDSLGYALLKFELVPGQYKMRVNDIADQDTVTAEINFSLRLDNTEQ